MENIQLMWAAVGDSYPVKDKLRKAGMKWNPRLKLWTSPEKIEVDAEGVEIVQIYEDGSPVHQVKDEDPKPGAGGLSIFELSAPAGISNTTYHKRCTGRQGNWWLMGPDGFVELGSHRGDRELSVTVELSPGTYTLGTGPSGKFGYRETITIPEEGDGKSDAHGVTAIRKEGETEGLARCDVVLIRKRKAMLSEGYSPGDLLDITLMKGGRKTAEDIIAFNIPSRGPILYSVGLNGDPHSSAFGDVYDDIVEQHKWMEHTKYGCWYKSNRIFVSMSADEWQNALAGRLPCPELLGEHRSRRLMRLGDKFYLYDSERGTGPLAIFGAGEKNEAYKALEWEPDHKMAKTPTKAKLVKKDITKADVRADRKAINGKSDRRKGSPLRKEVDKQYPDSKMSKTETRGAFTFHVVQGKQDMTVDIHAGTKEKAKEIAEDRYPGAKISLVKPTTIKMKKKT